jgi:transcriptional regulator with XRE-family HTH domain
MHFDIGANTPLLSLPMSKARGLSEEIRKMNNFWILPASGLNQAEFAAKIEATQAALSMYMNGKRTPSTKILQKISAAFNISVEDILSINAASSLDDAALLFLTAKLKSFSVQQINGLAAFFGQ